MTPPSAPPASSLHRWLPHPWWSLWLAACWLLLEDADSPGHWLMALLFALVLPRVLHAFMRLPPPPQTPDAPDTPTRIRIRWQPIPRLVAHVLQDILLCNLIVARQALGRMSALHPAWLEVPVSLRHPLAIDLLASIITNTPGTISCTISPDRRRILVHALHCDDIPGALASIHTRYEQPLAAIFDTPPETLPHAPSR